MQISMPSHTAYSATMNSALLPPPSGRCIAGALRNLHLQDLLTKCSGPAPGNAQNRTWRSRSGRNRGICQLNHYRRAAGTPRRDERIAARVAKLAQNCPALKGRMEVAQPSTNHAEAFEH